MACKRCGGLAIVERFDDLREEGTNATFWGRRCLNCGEIADEVIVVNRTETGRRSAAMRRSTRRW